MRKHGRPSTKQSKRTTNAASAPLSHPGQESEGMLDRIERIHRRPGVRGDELKCSGEPLRFRDSGDFETVADAMRRSTGHHQ